MEAAQLLELVLHQADEHALIMLDADGVVVGWLMGASKCFGRDAAEMVGHSLERLFTEHDRAAGTHIDELENARQTGLAEDDRWMVRRDGVLFWASGLVYALRDPDGRTVGFAKVLRDRTDVRGQIEALRNRAESFDAEDRRKTLVLGTVAHELRNPLGALLNAVQLIDLAYPGDAKLSYALQILRRQTTYVSKLIDDLLDVVRFQTGKTALHAEPLELRAVVEDAVETVAADLAARRQRIELVFPLTPIRLNADRVRLRQVFVNLLANASKFSGFESAVWIKATVEGGEAVVRVQDEGHGIPPALLPHVFDLLTQAPSFTAGDNRGLGLGLSLVKEYVELHGGSVQVRSDGIDRGSEFTVRIPLAQDAS
jgi:two-component system CheB/CheR fusion protein